MLLWRVAVQSCCCFVVDIRRRLRRATTRCQGQTCVTVKHQQNCEKLQFYLLLEHINTYGRMIRLNNSVDVS